jgi:hypothetical protein
MSQGKEVVAQTENAVPKITFSREYSVSLPSGETAYIIPASEWERIKRIVGRIVPPKNWFVVAGSICAGVFVSAVFCLIGFAAAWNNVPTWAKAVTGSAMVCAVVLSVGLFYLDTQQRGDIRESTGDVTREMERLEQSSQSTQAEANSRSSPPERI